MLDYEWADVRNWIFVREMEGYSDDKGNLHLVDLENVFIKKNKSVGIAWVNDVVIYRNRK